MANPHPSKPFAKGDPRINRRGRPKSFDALRELAKEIAHEVAQGRDKDGRPTGPMIIDGHKVTVAEAVLRSWFTSKNPQLQKAAIEIAFGKVPDTLDVNSNSKVLVRVVYGTDGKTA
jgi:hypothetical protein